MNQGRVEQQGSPSDVYQHPASSFVYGFLGNVNLFHGKIHEGILQAGSAAFATPQHQNIQNATGVGYVRPHELDVTRYSPGAQGLAVQLRRIHSIGPLTQLELERDDNNELVEALIPTEIYQASLFRLGETLMVSPRRLDVFLAQSAA